MQLHKVVVEAPCKVDHFCNMFFTQNRLLIRVFGSFCFSQSNCCLESFTPLVTAPAFEGILKPTVSNLPTVPSQSQELLVGTDESPRGIMNFHTCLLLKAEEVIRPDLRSIAVSEVFEV